MSSPTSPQQYFLEYFLQLFGTSSFLFIGIYLAIIKLPKIIEGYYKLRGVKHEFLKSIISNDDNNNLDIFVKNLILENNISRVTGYRITDFELKRINEIYSKTNKSVLLKDFIGTYPYMQIDKASGLLKFYSDLQGIEKRIKRDLIISFFIIILAFVSPIILKMYFYFNNSKDVILDTIVFFLASLNIAIYLNFAVDYILELGKLAKALRVYNIVVQNKNRSN